MVAVLVGEGHTRTLTAWLSAIHTHINCSLPLFRKKRSLPSSSSFSTLRPAFFSSSSWHLISRSPDSAVPDCVFQLVPVCCWMAFKWVLRACLHYIPRYSVHLLLLLCNAKSVCHTHKRGDCSYLVFAHHSTSCQEFVVSRATSCDIIIVHR